MKIFLSNLLLFISCDVAIGTGAPVTGLDKDHRKLGLFTGPEEREQKGKLTAPNFMHTKSILQLIFFPTFELSKAMIRAALMVMAAMIRAALMVMAK
jgi:hypothetical protein